MELGGPISYLYSPAPRPYPGPGEYSLHPYSLFLKVNFISINLKEVHPVVLIQIFLQSSVRTQQLQIIHIHCMCTL
jgi:hypothetical protein